MHSRVLLMSVLGVCILGASQSVNALPPTGGKVVIDTKNTKVVDEKAKLVATVTPIAGWQIDGKAQVIFEGRTIPGMDQSPHVEELLLPVVGGSINATVGSLLPGMYKIRVYVKFKKNDNSAAGRATAIEDVEVTIPPP